MRLRSVLAALLAGALALPAPASAQPGGAGDDGGAASAPHTEDGARTDDEARTDAADDDEARTDAADDEARTEAPDDDEARTDAADDDDARTDASASRHPTETWTAGAPPAMPASTVRSGVELSLRAVEGVHGLDVAPVTRAEWSPHAHLALGVLFAPQASFVGDGRTSLAQAGLAPLHAWIGSGARWDGGGFGVRARATISARLLGAPEADVGAETWSFALVLAAAHAFGPVELALELDAVLLSRGNFPRSAPGGAPYSGAGGGTLSARFGEPGWPVRPTLAIEVRGANDLGVAGRVVLGAWFSLPAEVALHVWLRGAWPGDPEALVGTLGIDVVVLRL